MIEKISNLLVGDKTLFLIDDIIADETLDKCRQPLLELAISGRHRGHSLWLLTQSYTAVEQETIKMDEMRKQPSKSEVIGFLKIWVWLVSVLELDSC